MTTYWKAVRADGRDFHTGSVDYAATAGGEPVTPDLPIDADFPGPGWLHLATVPTECLGMSWPCRLFEVEPVGEIHRDADYPHKVGCRSARVLREVDAHLVFGPQGHEVLALIDRARRLTGDEAKQLDATQHAAEDAAVDAAWTAAWIAARGAAWAAARDAAGDTAQTAARDAAGALIVHDLITDDQYQLLTGPWRDVIGDPMLVVSP